MEAKRQKAFALDLALLGETDVADWSAADRVRLEQLRAADRSFLEAYRVPARAVGGLGGRRGFGFGMAAALLLAGLFGLPMLNEPDQVRAKGSGVELFVQRDGGIEPFGGEVLHPGETLVFRYSTHYRYAVLAGSERSGRSSIYANMPIEPGESAWLPTGVRLDDYEGEELVIVILSDVPISDERILGALAVGGPDHLWTSDAGGRLQITGEAHLFWLRKAAGP